MRKLWKALATLVVLVLLMFPGFARHMPQALWAVLLVVTLTYGISLLLSTQIPAYRRWGIAYLAFTGLTYLLAGLLGIGDGGWVEPELWDMLISPYPLISFVDQWMHHFPYGADRAPYISNVPFSEHRFFSAAVVVLSSIAIVAAFAMAKTKKLAYMVWLVLLCVLILAFSGFVVVGLVSGGPVVLPFCMTLSYVVAFLMARADVDFKTRPVPDKVHSSEQRGKDVI